MSELIPTFSRPRNAAGQAYLLRPGDDGEGTGPGVLLLHSWWGLTAGVKDYCGRLCDAGFVVLAPDLSEGRRPGSVLEAAADLADSDPNVTAGLIVSSAVALRSATNDPSGPVAVVGFGMGASWALWLAARQPESFSKVVAHYGTQTVGFEDLRASVLGHFAVDDDIVDPDELVALEAELFELGHEPEFWHYDGVGHGFAEVDDAAHDAAAAELAFERTLAFLLS